MRRIVPALVAALVAAAGASPASAALLWLLTVSPGTGTVGVTTTYSLTATNLHLLDDLGCLEIHLPTNAFLITGASGGRASNGEPWSASIPANGIVVVHTPSGGGRLELGQSVSFTITAKAIDNGLWSWSSHAHRDQGCTGPEILGASLPISVVGGAPDPTPKPTATPTPKPTPKPTATPTPKPTPSPTAPPRASSSASATPRPTPQIDPPAPSILPPEALPWLEPSGAQTPSETRSPDPDPSVEPSAPDATSPEPGGSQPPTNGGGGAPTGGPGSGTVLLLPREGAASGTGRPSLALGPLGVLDGLTVWAIPAAVLGGPGLLVILWVALQTGVAAAWIPAVRRLRGRDSRVPFNRAATAG